MAATLLGMAAPAGARTLLSQKEALDLAFPGCEVQRSTAFLTAAEKQRAGELAGEPARSALVPRYLARCGGKPAGTAYVDVHTVRTLQETILVVVDPAGRVGRVEVLSFDEPSDYLPRAPWYAQFRGRPLDGDLEVARGIHAVSGASLTARATTAAVRRVLAVHQALAESAAAKARPASSPAAETTPVHPPQPPRSPR